MNKVNLKVGKYRALKAEKSLFVEIINDSKYRYFLDHHLLGREVVEGSYYTSSDTVIFQLPEYINGNLKVLENSVKNSPPGKKLIHLTGGLDSIPLIGAIVTINDTANYLVGESGIIQPDFDEINKITIKRIDILNDSVEVFIKDPLTNEILISVPLGGIPSTYLIPTKWLINGNKLTAIKDNGSISTYMLKRHR